MAAKHTSITVAAVCLLVAHFASPAAAAGPHVLKIAVVQLGLDATLAENRDKIIRLAGEAAAGGARAVVFPEGALAAPQGEPRAAYDAAVAAVAQAAREHNIYLVTGARFVPEGAARHHNQLYVFAPQGETLLVYDKVWHARKYDAPKLVSIDGVPCAFILCADRWSRPVESLPAIMGAKIIIECSNNYDTEWNPALQWYWYAPRAIRNTSYVVFCNSARENRLADGQRGHGHSAVIAPDGSLVSSAGDERDAMLNTELDISLATGEMAARRSAHPLFKDWWAMGRAIHAGEDFPAVEAPARVSADQSVKCGFGLMACTSAIERNTETIRKLIGRAAGSRIDLIVFPELALTGDRAADIERAREAALAVAVEAIGAACRQHKLTAVVGAPSFVGGRRRNSAYVLGPDGSVLTRYDQIVVDRPDLFEGGMSTKAMWFQVNGIWSVVSIGADAIWTEMAELAAIGGARLHCHLRHDRNRSPAEALLHEQQVANLTGYRTLSIVANPLHPELMGDAHARFSVGSGIWDDLEAGDWCAAKVQSGRPWEGVFAAPRLNPGSTNPLRQSGYWRSTTPRYQPWMLAGVAAMDRDR